MTAYLLRGARPLGADPVDLLLRDGVIAAVGPDLAGSGTGLDLADAERVDATGLVALPGLVDLHTHLREPGREDAETVETGTRAAARGGFTAVHAMANTDPVADTAGVVEQVWRLGREAGHCDVFPVGAVTVGLGGERLAELGAMADSAARVRVFSDDGRCVSDAVLMRRALEYVKAFGGVVAQHAQEPRLTEDAQMNESELSGRLGLRGWPAVAEEAIIARDCLLAAHVDSRLHVCHVSTAGSVEIVRWAKSKGWNVTAEVCPHHLLLTDDLAATYDPVYKVNPPLRSTADVAALRAGLADGTIDVVATDHAPHPHEDKDCEWQAAAFGMLGLETALSVVQQTMVDTGLLDWAGVAERMSSRPAQIGRSEGHGRPLALGEPANVVLYDPSVTAVVDPTDLVSLSRNTPYAGRELPGRVVATFLRGTPTVLDGKLPVTDSPAWVPVVLLFGTLGLAYVGMLRGWRRRGRRHELPPLVPVPDPDDRPAAVLEAGGRYFGTTVAGEWLDRVVARGLGARSTCALSLTTEGLDVVRLAGPFRIPAGAMLGARHERGIAGKVVPPHGLLVVTWRHGALLLDTGFRLTEFGLSGRSRSTGNEHETWIEAIAAMTREDR